MIGHLGNRVSALLDGQLPPEDAERAWDHVHSCHVCRDLVEREGWVKTRLAGLSFGVTSTPDHLRGSLLHASALGLPPGEAILATGVEVEARPRRLAMAALGSGAAGAAVVGLLALGAAPADAPTIDRRLPTTTLFSPTSTPANTPPAGPNGRADLSWLP